MTTTADLDTTGLERDLRAAVSGEVRFDRGSRAAYATDASNYRQVPIGVVVPRSVDDVVATVAACRRHGAPVLSRGGGTSLAGQCCNVAVVIDWSKYLHQVLELDPERRIARVQPGCVLDFLRDAAERHHLTFGPDPSTHNRNTLGGMIGNDSCGVHSVMSGRTADNVEELEILLYDGTRLRVGPTSEDELERIVAAGGRRGELYGKLRDLRDRYADRIRAGFPDIPRRVSGYSLDELLPENGCNVARALVGSEGTCVTVLEATVRLVPSPPARSMVVLGFPTVYDAGRAVPDVLAYEPVGLEGLDRELIEDMRRQRMHPQERELMPEGHGWLLVELGGQEQDEANANGQRLVDGMRARAHPPSVRVVDDPREQARIWTVREAGLGATARVPGQPDAWPGWEDSAVAPDRIGDYLRDLRDLYDRYHYRGSLYGHFGDGCVHVRTTFDLKTAPGIAKFTSFLHDAADLVVSYGGSLSGEHGDGQARGPLLERMYGPELVQAFREFKAIWDPDDKMNPGKGVDGYGLTDNLRLGADYRPAKPATHFAFPEDDYDFSRSALRCVGVGLCRREEAGTMCPSYMVTREEEHSTRGRARLLFELLQGDVVGRRDGSEVDWHDDNVHDALDLCLACKGCKGDCPVSVDMATYKAEFLSHYYAGRLRPPSAYALGLIYWAARIAARMPDVANLVTHAPGLSTLLKRLGGVAVQRNAPRFARTTFTDWFAARPSSAAGRGDTAAGRDVLVWPDTFNNHFHPEVGRATVGVLEALGYRVKLPPRSLCCGRPLYDYGMLDLAKRQLRQILDVLRDDIAAGVPLVAMEPSCLVVFRDELLNLLPHDEDAKRLNRQSFLLTEFLDDRADEIAWPRSLAGRRIVLHGHCHQKSTFGMDADLRVLDRLGVDYDELDSGCCGMAGSFGFEAEHYDVSRAVGERVLLPAARGLDPDTPLVTSGFSCREQVAQLDGRRPVRTHELLRSAFTGAAAGEPMGGGVGVGDVLRANRGAAVAAAAAAALAAAGRRSRPR